MLVNLWLIRAGYFPRRPLKKPLLVHKHRQVCMEWARNHLRWWPGHWQHVIFSDESRFLLYRKDCRTRVCRQQHDRGLNEDGIIPRVQAGAVELPYGVLSTMVENVTFTSSMETCIMENEGIEHMEWPAIFPDMNPIENLRSEVQNTHHGCKCQPA